MSTVKKMGYDLEALELLIQVPDSPQAFNLLRELNLFLQGKGVMRHVKVLIFPDENDSSAIPTFEMVIADFLPLMPYYEDLKKLFLDYFVDWFTLRAPNREVVKGLKTLKGYTFFESFRVKKAGLKLEKRHTIDTSLSDENRRVLYP